MNNDIREVNKFLGCFDGEVIESLTNSIGKHLCKVSEIISESGGLSAREGVFSDIAEDISGNCHKESMEIATRIDSPSMECRTPTPGTCEEKFNNEKFCFSPREEKPPVHSGTSKKRKRSSIGENDDFKDRLFSMLETNSRVLTAHMESQNLNSQLDRNQRREQAESLVSVLGRLADALGRIAERL
eukprot:c23816_g1_i1 orf=316-873(+)